MECLLCTIWARMPHAKRYTTPTTAQETEMALVIGYWLAGHQLQSQLCERHVTLIKILDNQEEQRIENEKQRIEDERIVQMEVQRLKEHHQRTVHLYERQQSIIEASKITTPLHVPEVIPTVVAQLSIPSSPEPDEFKLGPGPLTNENVITPHPPLPVQTDLSQPYRTQAQPGTAEAAVEVASLPPVEGAKVTYPCHLCGKSITTGEVHAC